MLLLVPLKLVANLPQISTAKLASGEIFKKIHVINIRNTIELVFQH